ncbi:MAG TPA: hypothetical protein DD811_02200 [Syntrophomonas sp.]|jgi:hypothetical protein|nr:hypothetical protein [Syntrophomonas sp.]
MFDFHNLIERYSSAITIISQSEGYHDYENGGIWVPGTEDRIETSGAVLPLSSRELNEQLQYGEGGAYTRSDRKLYTHEDLETGELLEHSGNRYTVAEKMDYADIASGLRIYYIRRVE